jgi:hypothetical protein
VAKRTENFIAAIERMLRFDASALAVRHCVISLSLERDSAYLSIRCAPTTAEAEATFAHEGNQFVAPVLTSSVRHADGTVSHSGPADFASPIVSTERLAGVGDDSYLWRGYGNNERGVVKFLIGRFIGQVNAPTVTEASRLAGRIVELLR